MSDKEKALFLLEAIGELSDKTVAEAKTAEAEKEHSKINRRSFDPAVLAASVVLIVAVTAALILGIAKFQTRTAAPGSSTADETIEGVGMEYAVKAAMDSLSEAGVSSTLSRATLVNDKDRPYYLVKLASRNGSYDCEVDAQSGLVRNIAYKIEATEPAPTEVITREAEPEYEEDYDDGYEEEYNDYDLPSMESDILARSESIADDFKEWNESHGISYSLLDGVTGSNSYDGSPYYSKQGQNQNGVSPYSDVIRWYCN